ncbi:hypothetical protein MHBO_002736 [Bonamia ostreae]|uniref:Uncharacterized protein n=2 Tax=Bonamia ostreae TaxID=126728 RepID=A0ABV2ANC3_9EUKA
MTKPKKVPDGWVFFPCVDSPGHDIIQTTATNTAILAKRCLNRKAVAFNSNGWIKRKIENRKKWYKWTDDETEGLYVLNSALKSSEKILIKKSSEKTFPKKAKKAKFSSKISPKKSRKKIKKLEISSKKQ